MLNTERGELKLQPTPVAETPKKNGHIPRWARVPAFALRASLAILTAAPGVAVAADLINHIEDTATVNSQYNLDSPQVYQLHLNANGFVIRGFRDEANFGKDFLLRDMPVDRTRIIDNGGNTGIKVKAEQTIEFSGSGKVDFCSYLICGEDPYTWSKSCKEAPVFNPDGYHIWRDNTICPGDAQKEAPQGMLLGFLYYGSPSGISGTTDWYSPTIQIGSHWKGIMDSRRKQEGLDGGLYFKIQQDYGMRAQHGGYDVTVTVYPPEPKVLPTVPVVTPIAVRKVEVVTTPERSSDLPGWLLGLGSTLLAGLASYKLYERWRFKRGVSAGATAGASAGFNAGSTFRIGGPVVMLGGPSNPNTAPNFGSTQPKNPEWIIGQQEFEKRWQAAKSNFTTLRSGDTGNEPEYILERFKAAMGVMHEVSLNSTLRVPLMAMRVRAGIEYLIPQVWLDNRMLKRFFDPGFNAGFLTNEDLAKILYLPEQYRSLSNFTDQQRRGIRRIRRILMFALHPDTAKVDADKNLQESVDDLLKKFNPSWSYIDRLIR